jgi:hypothetical protein
MQQIVYREFPIPPKEYPGGDPMTIPTPQEVGGLCAMMQEWAQTNGWRVVSVTPVTGMRRRAVPPVAGMRGQELPVHTVGLVFVCDKL